MNKFMRIVFIALLTALFTGSSDAQGPVAPNWGRYNGVKNIVLVHGAWADGSSWSKVIPLLEAGGFHVVAAQLPLTSLKEDDAAVDRAIARITAAYPGPVLLVGHSYAGVVIGDEPGNNPSVVGLVYVAAFALDTGQSALGLLSTLSPQPLISKYLVFDSPTAPMFATISPEGIKLAFANGLSEIEHINLAATQGPTSLADLTATPTVVPAWKSKPSWFIIAQDDNVITAGLEQQEAERIHAQSITLPTCHVAMLQEPGRVALYITAAALSLHGE